LLCQPERGSAEGQGCSPSLPPLPRAALRFSLPIPAAQRAGGHLSPLRSLLPLAPVSQLSCLSEDNPLSLPHAQLRSRFPSTLPLFLLNAGC